MIKKIRYLLFLLPVSILFCGCDDKTAIEAYIPLIETPEVEIFDDGVVFKTLLRNKGTHQISEVGLEWRQGTTNMGTYKFTGPFGKSDYLDLTVDYCLPADQELTVRAFIKTMNQNIITPWQNFRPRGSKPPVVKSISALQGIEGDEIFISASGLPNVVYDGIGMFFLCHVYFGFINARLLYLDNESIRLIVPGQPAGTGTVKLRLRVPGHEIEIGEFSYLP